MKYYYFFFTLITLFWSNNLFAYDIAAKNDDGVIIYYDIDTDVLKVTYKSSFYQYGVQHYESNYSGNIVIPEEVTDKYNNTRKVVAIGEHAFDNCSSLTSVTIPNTVKSIGEMAFYVCTNLTSVTIPYSVTSIGNYAFGYCNSLKSFYVLCNLKNIGNNIFEGCTNLNEVSFDCEEIKPLFRDIPSITTINMTDKVTSIDDYAFSKCSGITSVTIPNSVISIGDCAFRECGSLASVTIGNNVTSIGEDAFYKCTNMTSLTLGNSIKTIEKSAFSYCKNLTSILVLCVPERLEDDIFYSSNINEVTFDCEKVVSLFRNTNVKKIAMTDKVTSIGMNAFYNCYGLTSVTIPNSVTSIGYGTFASKNISTVVSLIENPFRIIGKTSDLRTFSQNTFNNATLYVPVGTIDKYKTTDGWKDFVFIEEGLPTEIRDVVGNKTTENRRYTINGEIITTPKKGINIIKMSDGTTKKVLVK